MRKIPVTDVYEQKFQPKNTYAREIWVNKGNSYFLLEAWLKNTNVWLCKKKPIKCYSKVKLPEEFQIL